MHTDLSSVYQPDRKPTKLLFIVHGTFAEGAAWATSGSDFCQSLIRELGPQTLIQSFNWSGQNSVSARETAAVRLSQLLQQSVADFPGVPHFVIGHSHGGNVALSAAALPDLANVHVICLSTPILYAVPRRALTDSKTFLWLLLSIPFLGLLFAWLFIQVEFEAELPAWLYRVTHVRWSFNVLYWPCFFVAVFFSYLCWRALVSWNSSALRVAKTIEVPHPDPNRALFLRFVGDEASLALTAFQALQYAMNVLIWAILGIFSLFVRMYEWAQGRMRLLFAVLYVPIAIGMAFYLYDSKINLWFLFVPFVAAILLALLLLLVTPVLAILALLIGVASVIVAIFPFGPRLALASMWIELCVEAAPLGKSNLLVLAPSAQSVASGLRHSFCYQEEPAIRAMVEYIEGRTENRRIKC
jgi:pimeloyl-ACP methyl ester carboxylesterase